MEINEFDRFYFLLPDFQKRLETECIKVKFHNDKTTVIRKIFYMKNINYKDINLEEIILELEHNDDKGPIKVMSDDLKSSRIILHGFVDKKLLFDSETMKYEEKNFKFLFNRRIDFEEAIELDIHSDCKDILFSKTYDSPLWDQILKKTKKIKITEKNIAKLFLEDIFAYYTLRERMYNFFLFNKDDIYEKEDVKKILDCLESGPLVDVKEDFPKIMEKMSKNKAFMDFVSKNISIELIE